MFLSPLGEEEPGFSVDMPVGFSSLMVHMCACLHEDARAVRGERGAAISDRGEDTADIKVN